MPKITFFVLKDIVLLKIVKIIPNLKLQKFVIDF